MTVRLRLIALVLAVPIVAGAQGALRPDADPRIEKIVAAVSEQRMRELLTKLVSFGTRNTLSDQASATRGIGAARNWILEEMRRSSEKLRVNFDTHIIPPQGRITKQVDLRNVVAILPGKSPRRIYVSGHYDSLNIGGQNRSNAAAPGATPAPAAAAPTRDDYDVEAPGANDDGSGTVLTMELARVFAESGIEFDATLVFICWAGEEQGLVGSRAHAEDLAAKKIPVEAVFNNDIVGNSRGGNGIVDAESVRVYAIGPEDSPARALARHIVKTAGIYVPSHRVRPMAREDRFGRGSDQSSFTAQGFPAIVFREANENFEKQHGADDTLDGVDFGYLAQNARVNAAGVASLALAPPAPKVTNDRGGNMLSRDPSGYDAAMRWNAAPGAVAYRVYWRGTWTNDWQHSQTVGNITQFTLKNVSIDDFVFGVSAISADGQESMISAYVSPVRRDQPLKRQQ
ncbi:MAG TPA: M20/M25/M40 family metallo-hydrolase [Vicinamibacterales bacterium]